MSLILGIDLGKKIGIAKAYEDLKVALPYKIVYSFTALVDEVNLLKPKYIVVGLPLKMDDSEGDQCLKVRSSAANLIHQTYKMEVFFEDERYTTQTAKEYLKFSSQKNDDALSAALILQNFLNKIL